MMDIRPAEISAILKQQIADFGTDAEVAEVGQVLSVGDGIARIYGMGGMVVRVGSKMIDSSLATKLQKLRLAMKGIG